MECASLDECVENWDSIAGDYKTLENVNKEYLAKVEEVSDLQGQCMKQVSHQKYRLNFIAKSLKNYENDERQDIIKRLWKDINHRRQQLSDIEQSLPKPNGTYLKIILGNVNVSILNKEDKFRYKDEYEKFKLVLSIIGFFLSLLNLVTHRRGIELTFLFLLVWYYCTLTIRESILKVNGSKIKGWWRIHHFISTVASAVLLVWPNSETWFIFRPQFMIFNVLISVVQSFQFIYQQGVLYRLKALGERHNMDITIEGFHSWMWRGLSFLLPFLYLGYIFQLYNAFTLYKLCYHPHATWQVPVLSGLFFILFLGNAVTTSMVIPEKLREVKIRRIIKTYTRKMSGNRLGADPKKSD
ncbi:hypothetical protein ACI65C_002242 [Semiaphis heraclei]